MENPRRLAGRDLRLVLTQTLLDRGPLSTAQLVASLESRGFELAGRASKTVSDALRWEVGRGRVRRLGRGRYGPGTMSRTMAWRVRTRTRDLQRGARG
jgi:hypothetical protein